MRELIEALKPATRRYIKNEYGKRAFGVPERLAWPVHTVEFASRAIRYMQRGWGDKKDYPAVKKAIKRWHRGNQVVMDQLRMV